MGCWVQFIKRAIPMQAFHLDMKAAQYRADYLASLFRRLADLQYTHIFFEIEDKVRLESIRGAEWCEAFSKEEFADLLGLARRAGLTPVPLIQTLGHLEFLLSHAAYHPLRETPKSAYMICPSNPHGVRYLLRFIDEVHELFGKPPFLHLGADEVPLLGTCPACRSKVEKTSKSALFFDHMKNLLRHVVAKGTRPMAWADEALRNPEALDSVERDLVWVDWDYWTPERNPETLMYWRWVKFLPVEQAPKNFLAAEGRFALDDAGRIRPWFYTDFLVRKGFDVVLAPSTRCFGDHVFAARADHLANVSGACLRLTRDPKPLGMLVTSWAARLNHIETQWPAFALPSVMNGGNAESWEDVKGPISKLVFGRPAPRFFDAARSIGVALPLAESFRCVESDTHYYGQMDSIPYVMDRLREQGMMEKEMATLGQKKAGYVDGAAILDELASPMDSSNACFRFWRFAAEAMQVKAKEFELSALAPAGKADADAATRLLLDMEALRDEYRTLLVESYTPASTERELAMVFGSSLRYAMRLAHGATR